MLRRRFHSSGIYPSNAGNGVYGVAKNLKLLPSNKVDADWNGKSNSEVLKKIGATEQGSYTISGNLLNGFINSSDDLGFYDWYIPSCPQMSLIYMRMVDINDILYLIGGKMFQPSTEAYMTSSECNDRNYWSVPGFGQVDVSDKRNPKRIRLIRDL